ncbi:glycosyltransferase, partial [Chloroflexota bacterium]
MTVMSKSNNTGEEPLTIVAYVSDHWEHVCPTIRISGPAEQAGIQLIRGNDWLNGSLRVYPERVSQADIVLIQRDFPSHVDEYNTVASEAQIKNKVLVYEMDDLLTELPEQHPDIYHYITARTAIMRAVVEADAVVGSTPAICNYLRRFNDYTHLFHNYLDDQLYQLNPPTGSQDSPLVIGYMGGHSHAYDLKMIAPILENILGKYGDHILLRFWGVAPPPTIQHRDNVERISPDLLDYAKFASNFLFQAFDIFIAPLANNLFNQCKSHLKFLEYSALGVPGVYSRITPYENIVIHGENGYLASTQDEWERYLRTLIENPALRTQIGINAQETVRSKWMLSQHVNLWTDLYHQLSASGKQSDKSEIPINLSQKSYDWQ